MQLLSLSPRFRHKDMPRQDGDKEAPPELPPSPGLPATCPTAISRDCSLSVPTRMIHTQMQRHKVLRSVYCKIEHPGDCLAQSHFSPRLPDSGDSPRANLEATSSSPQLGPPGQSRELWDFSPVKKGYFTKTSLVLYPPKRRLQAARM